MITKRTLQEWRRQALIELDSKHTVPVTAAPEQLNIDVLYRDEHNRRIVRLTQELLDLHLMRRI